MTETPTDPRHDSSLDDEVDELPSGTDDTLALQGIRLQTQRVEVRLSRARAKARLFGRRSETTQLGRFVVLARVGSGGMGQVYQAYDPQLDRRVAIKVLRADVVRHRWPALRAQLVAEARAMARLSHPHVVTVFEVDTQDDEVFIAMEYVEAPTLRAWMSQGVREVDEILDVFVQAGRGLAAAHEAGLVHRDFKPENVLVPEDAPVRVTDFGLARVVSAAEQPTGLRPHDAGEGPRGWARAGTPAYMAPEQCRGETVDARTDQFAFCVALFEALAGHRPWSSEELAADREHPVTRAPAPALERDDVDRRVVEAIARGLAAAPDERPESMQALLMALSPPPRRHWRTLAGGGLALLTAGVATGAALMAEPGCPPAVERMADVWDPAVRETTRAAFEATELDYADAVWPQVRDRIDRYRESWLDGRQRACRATAAGEQSEEALDLRIACLDDQHDALAALTRRLREVDAAGLEHALDSTLGLPLVTACDDVLALRERQVPVPPEHREAVHALHAGLADVHALLTLARYGDAESRLEALHGDLRAVEHAPLDARAHHLRGQLAAVTADTDAAVKHFDRALTLAGELRDTAAVADIAIDRIDAVTARPAESDRAAAMAEATEVLLTATGADAVARGRLRLAQGRIAFRQGDYDEGLLATREALSLMREASDADRQLLADALQQVGTLLYTQGHLDEAAEHGESALSLRETLLGPDHPDVAQSRANLGAIALAKSDADTAHASFARAADIQRAALGARHPALARTLSNLCTSSLDAGNYERALAECTESVQVGEAAHGVDDPSVSMLLLNLGSVQQQAGQLQRAQQTYERAQPLLEQALGADHPQFGILLANLGRLHDANDDPKTAEGYFRRTLALRRKGLGPDHPSTLRVRQDLADMARRQGRFDEAATESGKVLADMRTAIGEEHPYVALPLLNLGIIAREQGDLERARDLLEQALDIRTRPPVRPEDLAFAQAELARVLWADPATRARAAALVVRAEPHIADSADLAELRAWAASHRDPASH
ncbi:MAG: tetratricopeptide repeat protein [Myxococcota bacterium]